MECISQSCRWVVNKNHIRKPKAFFYATELAKQYFNNYSAVIHTEAKKDASKCFKVHVHMWILVSKTLIHQLLLIP